MRDRLREREDGPGDRHRHEQDPVAAASAEPVAVPGEERGDERRPRQQRGEHSSDLGAGEAAAGERLADHDRTEPVRDRPERLDADQPSRVRTQPEHQRGL